MAYLYCRVSSSKQFTSANSVSIDMQKEIGRKFCLQNNFKINGEFIDVVSALDMDKQSMLQMIVKDLINKGDIIIVYDVSRFSRSVTSKQKTITKNI